MRRQKPPNPEWFTTVYSAAEKKAGSRAALAKVLGAPDSTLQGWTHPVKPVTPKIDHIQKLFDYIGGNIMSAFPGYGADFEAPTVGESGPVYRLRKIRITGRVGGRIEVAAYGAHDLRLPVADDGVEVLIALEAKAQSSLEVKSKEKPYKQD